MKLVFKFYILLTLWASQAVATEMFEINTTVRALGMGNAYTAVVNDGHSIFYNPAGLARANGYYWSILDLQLGLSGRDAFETLANAQDAAQFANTLQALYGKNVWISGGGRTILAMPNFGITYYDNFDASMYVDNPVSPELMLNVINDMAIGASFAFELLPGLHFGGTLKRIQRTGTRRPIGSDELADLNPDTVFANYDQNGIGYSADLGVNLIFPAPMEPTISFVYKNMGNTSFRAVSGNAPPGDDQEMIVGLAAKIDTGVVTITPALDFKYLLSYREQLGKKLNLGLEVSFPVIDARAGFHQGYYTYGVGVDLGLFRVDAATYGVEMGEYPGQKEDRRYVLQFIMELGVGSDNEIFGGSAGGSGSDGVRGKSNSRSRRLKQRR